MRILVIFLFVMFSTALSAQTCSCCDTVHRQFDFWVGDWKVTNTKGERIGENQITKQEDGCIIAEHWQGGKGGTGRSMNYYNKADSTWNQLWISNSANILKLKGKFHKDRMVLKSKLTTDKNGGKFYNQISWIKNEDGTVSQLWEIYNENSKVLDTLFLGIYHKI